MERLCIVYILAMTGAIAVEGLCFYPCPRQVRGTYVSIVPVKGLIGIASCENPSKATLNGEVEECYARSGAFFIQRRKGTEYRCTKEMSVDPIKGFVLAAYVKPWANFSGNPDFCDVCAVAGSWTAVKFIAQEVLGQPRYSSETVPPLGCNVPMGCPITNPSTDILCTGCEPQEDDGLCCKGCSKKRRYDSHSYY